MSQQKLHPLGALAAVLCGFLAAAGWGAAAAAEDAPQTIVRDFSPDDPTRLDWFRFPRLQTLAEPPAEGAEASPAPYLAPADDVRGTALHLPVHFPGTATIARGSAEKPVFFAAADRFTPGGSEALSRMAFSLYIPDDLPPLARITAAVFMKNKDGLWFQAQTRRRGSTEIAGALRRGWNELWVDFSETAGMFQPRGHDAVWSTYRLSQTQQFGVMVECDREYRGVILFDDFVTAYAVPETRPLAMVNLRLPEKMVDNQLYEISFNVTRMLLNPFSTGEIDIVADFFEPDLYKPPTCVPAFYYQDFNREKGTDDGSGDYRDRYTPRGEGEFRIRYLPNKPGNYLFRFRIKHTCPYSGKVTRYTSPDYEPTAEPNPDPVAARRFVRVSPKDPRSFEFANGEYFYPLGHNFHTPYDKRHHERILKRFYPGRPLTLDRGLRVYEDAFVRMEKNGLNAFEVWMSSWWLALEWTGRWKGYQGVGRYNLENAWKLDALLAAAARHGLYAHLVVDNHGKATEHTDAEWKNSPYNIANRDDNGVCREAADLFSSVRARTYYRDLYRYIAARWGWCPNIFGVEMWSELNLASTRSRSGGKADAVYRWHEEMAETFHEWDQGGHLLTTHYSGDYNVIDFNMVKRPFIGYAVGDAYHGENSPLSDMLFNTDKRLYELGKPFMITEYGGSWDAAALEGLFGDIFGAMWTTWMTRAAGSPFCWWYEYILQEDLYVYFAAFKRYIAGEDKRRGPDEPQFTNDWGAEAVITETAEKIARIRQLAAADQKAQTARLVAFNTEDSRLGETLKQARAARKKAEQALKTARKNFADFAAAWKKNPAGEFFRSANLKTFWQALSLPAAVIREEEAFRASAADVRNAENARNEHRKKRKEVSPQQTVLNAGGERFTFFTRDTFVQARTLTRDLPEVRTRVLGDGKIFYAYVYDYHKLHHMPLKESGRPLTSGAVLKIGKIPPGGYEVEIWDCYAGKILETRTLTAGTESAPRPLAVPLPDFPIQIALKIRKK